MTLSLISREIWVPSPGPGVAVQGSCHYTHPTGLNLISYHSYQTRSDTADKAYRRFSSDNGRTWSEPIAIVTGEPHPRGMLRRHLRGGMADPINGWYVHLWTEGVLPTDNPLEGLRQWQLFYAVSQDQGRTFGPPRLIIHAGSEYNESHPLPGVWRGRNSVMLGDMTCEMLSLPDGTILAPCQITPVGPDGNYYNPGGGYTYHYAAVLRGRWGKGDTLEWTISQPVEGDPERTTRGMVEPTIARLPDGRILMVMRGSNDAKPHLPGYKWMALSSDAGMTWTQPQPWTDETGRPYFSPSSCSQLLPHSSGRLFWLGNICETNPKGNGPRYPMMIGEVDRTSGCLMRDSLAVVDQRAPDESAELFLSNFHAREDRETGEIRQCMWRPFARQVEGQPMDWTTHLYDYRIGI